MRSRTNPTFNGLSSAESVHILITSRVNGAKSTLDANRPSDPSAQTVSYSLTNKVPAGACNLTLNLYSQAGETGTIVGTISTSAFVSGGGILYGPDNQPIENVQVTGIIANVLITTPGATTGQTAASVNAGSTIQFGFLCRDASNNPVVVTEGSETFSAQNTSIATITPGGLATGVTGGQTKIACVVDNIPAASLTLTVNPQPNVTVGWGALTRAVPLTSARSVAISFTDSANTVSTVTADRASFAANPGTYTQNLVGNKNLLVGPVALLVTFYDEAGEKGDVVGNWSQNVNMTPAGGLTSATGGALGTIDSTPVVARVVVNTPTAITVGGTEQLSFQCYDASNNLLANVAQGSGTFSSSGSVLTVSASGLVTGETAGSQNVTCTVDGVTSPNVSFTVNGGPTKPIVWVGFGAISRTLGALTSARSCKIVVTDSTNAQTTATVDRESYSTNNGAAYQTQMTFDNSIAVGSMTITGTWYAGTGETGQVVGNFQSSGTMTSAGVLDNLSGTAFANSATDALNGNPVITNVTITNASPITVAPSGTLQLTFQCYDTNNHPINVDPGSATFTTSGASLTVTPSGIVTGVAQTTGQNVTCTVDGVSTTVSVKVS